MPISKRREVPLRRLRLVRTLAILFWLLILSVFGAAPRLYPSLSVYIGIILSIVSVALPFTWYYADSKITGHRRTTGLNIAVVVLGWLAIIYYLARSRRGKARLRISLIVVGIASFGFAIYHLAALTAFVVVEKRAVQDQARTSDTYEITANDLEICAATSGNEKPTPINRREPAYPPIARYLGINGAVGISLDIGPDGRIVSYALDVSKPFGLFDRAVNEAIVDWRYCPLNDTGAEIRTARIWFPFTMSE